MKRVLLTALILLLSLSAGAQQSPKREFRGAWLHIVGNSKIKDMSREEIQEWFTNTLDALHESGCNAVIFQVRPQADAFFPSELEPWTRFLTGEQGVAPDPFWDPLQFMIDECHKRGMELHAWLNPYRVTSNGSEQLHPDHLFFKHPEIFKRYGQQLYFDPGEPLSREHTVKVIADIVTRYDVDGIHFDDYFYPYPVKYEEFHDDASFVKYGQAQGFEYWQKNDWRRNNVEILMKEINETIKGIKPYMKFGISPFGIHRNKKETADGSGSDTNGLSNYEALFADVPAWAEKGYIDYIVPQLYWKIGHPAADYQVLINWWNDCNFKGHLYIGQSINTFSEPDQKNPNTTQMKQKMELVRNLPNVDGNVWWPGWTIAQPSPFGFTDSLCKYQSHPALLPAYSDIDSIAPAPATELKAEKEKLTWKAPVSEDPMQQPHFYIVYKFPRHGKVDISDNESVEAIVKECSYTPKEAKKGNCRYVITVVDRCWNESEATKPIVW